MPISTQKFLRAAALVTRQEPGRRRANQHPEVPARSRPGHGADVPNHREPPLGCLVAWEEAWAVALIPCATSCRNQLNAVLVRSQDFLLISRWISWPAGNGVPISMRHPVGVRCHAGPLLKSWGPWQCKSPPRRPGCTPDNCQHRGRSHRLETAAAPVAQDGRVGQVVAQARPGDAVAVLLVGVLVDKRALAGLHRGHVAQRLGLVALHVGRVARRLGDGRPARPAPELGQA